MNRELLLDAAKHAVTQDRQAEYGDAADVFRSVAGLWESYLGVAITEIDVANLMILLKVARSQQNHRHYDNFTDIAGYAALAAELADDEV